MDTQETPKKKREFYNSPWFWFIVAIVIFAAIGASNNSSSPATSPEGNSYGDQGATPQAPNITKPDKPMSSFGDGTFVIGTDIQAGTYRSSGGENCYYARLSGFGGTTDDIIANDNTDSSAIVTIKSTDKGFTSKRCGTWTQMSSPPNAPTLKTPQPTTAAAQQTYTTPSGTVVDQSGNVVSVPASSGTQTNTTPSPSTAVNYSQFTPTYFYNFAGDPPAYLGTQIKVKGTINNQFLAAGDKGGSSNYIGIADPNAHSTATVMLKISSNVDYQKAVGALQYYDLIAAYGSGASSEYFTTSNGARTLVPVITVVRLDVIGACGGSGCGESSDTTIFP
ncbi:MAG: hypothetical protein KGH79_02130 [Patescibacteria group bacterium]|nr:hypothetical protein [Patescibacteria group bacterium]